MSDRLKVVVLFGGQSAEHEVSLVSAVSVLNNLDLGKFEVLPVGITKQGQWVSMLPPGGERETAGKLQNWDLSQLRLILSSGLPVTLVPGLTSTMVVYFDASFESVIHKAKVDVVFPVLHGPNGEDGTVQGLFEVAGVKYVGAKVMASAVGMDKAIMKALFQSAGLPVVPYLVIKQHEYLKNPSAIFQRIEEELGFPCFVKPARLGSSVGISKAKNRVELAHGIEVAFSYDSKLVIEQSVNAREIECSVLGNDEPIASLPGEIRPGREFYDYEAKYQDPRTELIIPAALDGQTISQVQALALQAFKSIDCSGMARVDFFLEQSTGKLYVNEINTIPGFTDVSMYPKLWEVSGVAYRDLLTRLINLAVDS